MNARDELIDRYAAGAEVLNYAVSGLSRELETARPGPGAWSIAELVAHLVDSDLVDSDRMKRVTAENEPNLPAYDESLWISRLRSNEMPVSEAVKLFGANRRWMSRMLRGCVDADFGRAGHHSERGRMTLVELVTGSTNHLDHHLRFLYGKRANLGTALQPRYTYPTA
jgi:uncharacterized damage-inducible protein DinB